MSVRNYVLPLLAGALLVAPSGCASQERWASVWQETERVAADHGPTESKEDWSFVGDEGRGVKPMVGESDSWWNHLTQSEKAQDIEENLGY